MPLPKPKSGDTRNKFISRCLKDDAINSEFGKNAAQKMAVCSSIWEHHGKSDEEIESEREYKSIPFEMFEVKTETKDDQEIGVFRGAFATQDKDLGGDVLASEAFDNTFNEYKKEKENIQLFYNHNINDFPLGIVPINSVEKQGKRWLIDGELNLATQSGRDTRALMKQGALTKLSFGYSVRDMDLRKDGTRFIKDVKLWEMSIVNQAMNPKAKINEVKDIPVENETVEEEAIPDTKCPEFKFDINDVKSLTNRKDFNELLSKSGAFSNEACEFLAGLLASTQRESVENYYLVLQKLNDLIQLTKRSKNYVRGNYSKT